MTSWHVGIDYLSFTFPMRAHVSAGEMLKAARVPLRGSEGHVPDFVRWVIYRLSGLVSGSFFVRETHGRFVYENSIRIARTDLGGQTGIIAWGGNRDTVLVSLSGAGCAFVDMSTMADFIQKLQGRITRVDLAVDDTTGKRPVSWAMDLYDMGGYQFGEGGRAPKRQLIDDFDNGSGKTFYVGKKENGKELCVYEKGKQLKDETSPWVRWEVRLANIDRIIPLDILRIPARYFAGAYPCLAWIGSAGIHIDTGKLKGRIALDHLIKYARRSYGKLLWACRKLGFDSESFMLSLEVEGIPKRLIDSDRGRILAALT